MEILALAGIGLVLFGTAIMRLKPVADHFRGSPSLGKTAKRMITAIIAVASGGVLFEKMWEAWDKLMVAISSLPGSTGYEASHLSGEARNAAFTLLMPAALLGLMAAAAMFRDVRDILAGKKDNETLSSSEPDFDYHRDVGYWLGKSK